MNTKKSRRAPKGRVSAYRALARTFVKSATRQAFEEYMRVVAQQHPNAYVMKAIAAFLAEARADLQWREGAR